MKMLSTLWFLSLLFLPAISSGAGREPTDRPNVIIVLLDDAGYGDFAHTGNPTIETPHITALVREGLNFPQFYAASPACSASRYSVLTGRIPARSGFPGWVLGPASSRYLHPDEITIAEGLRSVGYATAIIGKWHLGTPNPANGEAAESLPLAHGFDRWIGTDVSHDYKVSRLIQSNERGKSPVAGYELLAERLPGKPEIGNGLTSLYADEAVNFIRETKDRPFFLYLAHNMPHLELLVSDEFRGTSRRGLLGDVMAEIDASVGRICAELERLKIAQNTLLILASDNGPWIRFQDTETHKQYGEARMHVGYAHPFRDGKGSTWEGGIRSPGVFWWPGVIGAGRVEYEPASTLDLLPTIFYLAGVPLPDDRVLDGRNIAPFLNPTRFEDNVSEFSMVFSGGDNSVFALRKGPWKLHVKLFSQLSTHHGFEATRESPLLFQVEQDLGERFDRASEEPEIVRALLETLKIYEESASAEGSFWEES